MTAALAHRGPDAHATQRLAQCHLGHARLSIIDLAGGAQPMPYGERYWIVFNGEIYNYRELRQELMDAGRSFTSHSDTEVILVAYAHWGPSCVDRFRGMFAFAIWDARERRLFAARDLFGEKPLYYASLPDGCLLMASEIKALIASGLLDARLDLEAVDAFLALGYVPPDRAIYANVGVVPPGHCMEWADGGVRLTRYWQPNLDTRAIGMCDAAERLRELLGRAVRRQMVADVPVGAFLSGGLDSSTIVALMQKHSAHPIRTFSAGFGSLINELPYAEAVARQYHTEHHQIDMEMPPVPSLLRTMAEVFDEPFGDSSHIPTYLIAGFARQHVKVVLSGDGGDELFGGYGWYIPLAMSETMPRAWVQWLILRSASRLILRGSRRLHWYSGALGLSTRWPDMWTRAVMGQIYFRPAERARLWRHPAPAPAAYMPGAYYRAPAATRGLNEGFYFDLTCYLPGDILTKVDRAAMAHGLETRAPFLDRDLAEFALSLPAALKVEGDRTKIVLREACSRYWPRELHGRAKQGFGAPYDSWLKMPDVQALMRGVMARGSRLRRLLPGLHPARCTQRPAQAWLLLTLGLWLDSKNVSV